jgi:Raf kinase inhibitor-like YbhB/YbcL family protein
MLQTHLKALEITSSAFKANGLIPVKYTCEGEDINPPLNIKEVPLEAKSLVLIVEDPDAPKGTWLHWLVWNIRIIHRVNENEVPGVQGLNDFGRNAYGGPCPPSGKHRYFFKVYALDDLLDVPESSLKKVVEEAMRHHIIAYGELVGVYKKSHTGKKT